MRRHAKVPLLFLLGLLLLAAPGSSYEFIDYGGGPVHWEEATTKMYLHELSFPWGSDEGRALRNALHTWGAVDDCVFYFTANAGSSGFGYINYGMFTDGYNDCAGVAGYLSSTTYAATFFVYNYETGSDVLVDTDVLFNYDLIWSTTGHPAYPDLETTALHEFGHVVGLDHVNIPEAVMYPYGSNGEVQRSLHPDDEAGAQALYPAPELPQEAPPVSVVPEPLVFRHAEITERRGRAGDTIRVRGTVRNASDIDATVSSVVLSPGAVPLPEPMVLAPGQVAEVDLSARIVDAPGLYPLTARLTGFDGNNYFASPTESLNAMFEVEREILGYTLQDSLSAPLGPYGEDVIRLPLVAGTQVNISVKPGSFGWQGQREVTVREPSGRVLAREKSSGTISFPPLRAKLTGDYLVFVKNHGGSRGEYVLNTFGTPRTTKVKGKGEIPAGEPWAEIPLTPIPARCEIDATLKSKEDLRIVGYRTPSGLLVLLKDPLTFLLDFPASDQGVYRLLVETVEPAAGAVKVSVKGTLRMVDGIANNL